jgi:hypothetical protein
MLISQLYRTNPSLNDKGYEILQNWYKLTNEQKHDQMLWLADQLRAGVDGKKIAIDLAARLKIKIDSNYPPP